MTPLLLTAWLLPAGCSPVTSGGDGPPRDLSAVSRDLGAGCMDVPANLLLNPSFEGPGTGADPNGSAKNTGSPASTIPSWDGCCNQANGGTQWTVTPTVARCGTRSVQVQSTSADKNVLNQTFDRSGDAGKAFQLSGWVFVTQNPSGQILLDVFDLNTNNVVGSTLAEKSTTSDWFELKQSGTVPAGGKFQVRIFSTGTLQAYVDDLALVIP